MGARVGFIGRPTGRSLQFRRVIHMLLTVMISTCFAFSVLGMIFSLAAVNYTKKQNKRSVSLREIAILSDEVTNLGDAYASLLASHKKLRSRIGMRDKRAKDNDDNGSGEPDPRTDPQAWKTYMRKQLHMQKFGGK